MSARDCAERALTDAELVALAALVNADATFCHGENCIAAAKGHGFMSFQSDAWVRLENEMKRRGAL
jgi:hypothetical protein